MAMLNNQMVFWKWQVWSWSNIYMFGLYIITNRDMSIMILYHNMMIMISDYYHYDDPDRHNNHLRHISYNLQLSGPPIS